MKYWYRKEELKCGLNEAYLITDTNTGCGLKNLIGGLSVGRAPKGFPDINYLVGTAFISGI